MFEGVGVGGWEYRGRWESRVVASKGVVWVRGRVRSWLRMVQAAVSTKTTRIGAAARQS